MMVRRRSSPRVVLAVSLAWVGASCTAADDASSAGATPTGPVTTVPVTTVPATTAPSSTTSASSTTTTTTTDAPATTAPVTTVDEHRRELEAAGLGWMLDVEYPGQPAGVPWPTSAWPTGP
ncbi:MAG: hypothetical protein ABW122_11130, partial [Ilumatobacteraceae bacterium]